MYRFKRAIAGMSLCAAVGGVGSALVWRMESGGDHIAPAKIANCARVIGPAAVTATTLPSDCEFLTTMLKQGESITESDVAATIHRDEAGARRNAHELEIALPLAGIAGGYLLASALGKDEEHGPSGRDAGYVPVTQ